MNEWDRLHRQAQRYKEAYPPGTRIMLLSMGKDPNPVESGTRGTVRAVDDIGTLHCVFDNNVRKEQKMKHNGYSYVFSPYKLIWNGDFYYVVGYSEKHHGIGSFRVDRISRCPQILNEKAEQPPEDFDLNVYLNSMFHMYNGKRVQMDLVCDNDLMDAIIDKFGEDVTILANDMCSFRAIVNIAVGPGLYSWIFGFRGKVRIKAPSEVKDEYSKLVIEAADSLRKSSI